MDDSHSSGIADGGAHILVVDDDERNRRLLHDLLTVHGHRVQTAADGLLALQAMAADDFDVVLLDVMMPKMDGHEVCRRLKADERWAAIPVLMVTSLSERQDRIRGMQAGADDFLTKPVDAQEVQLRVRNAVRTKRLYDRVRDSFERLQALETLRDDLLHLVVHDMKSPLSVIGVNLEFLHDEARPLLDPSLQGCLDDSRWSTDQLLDMVRSLLDISRMEQDRMPVEKVECDLAALVKEAMTPMRALAIDARLVFDPPPQGLVIRCDRDLIGRVITNLTSNALRYTQAGSEVRLELSATETTVTLRVRDHGPGIPPEYRETIFDKFTRVEGHRKGKHLSTGLGLSFCKLAVHAHGGCIGVENAPDQGSVFWVELPMT